jgi:hypothetical protein
MTKQELRDLIAEKTAEFVSVGNTVKVCKTPTYKNITWGLDRHPWGLYNRGRQWAAHRNAAGAATKVQYT